MHRPLIYLLLLIAMGSTMSGCIVSNFIGGAMQNAEYQKQIEVLARYDLTDKRVAVVTAMDMVTQYEHPGIAQIIQRDVALRLGRDAGATILIPSTVAKWQYQTPHWEAMPFGEIAEQLTVDVLVYIDVHEYRLHPPGNRWEWQGVCAATIGIVEADAFDPDAFVDAFDIVAEFPGITGVGLDAATEQQIERGVLAEFIKQTAWLFHDHIEPKYPDKYRPELDPPDEG